ncbi:YeeE/YedE family protein [Rhexocercosporidium sp. MPI-PUGE-AT-0058]|nr:YeeE/YedE family protein [Rhexocercosporidium sp. MPI-PUGE-AT-0058]
MSTDLVATALSGSLFGSALLVSGVYSPSVISSQLLLSDFHMLKVFLTASASSAVLMAIAKRTDVSPCSPRKPSNLNRWHRYDGNVIGGLLLGSGMALTGACPGTVLVQIATGVSSGLPVLGGGILGGILWTRFGYCAKCTTLPASADAKEGCDCAEEKLTVYESANLKESQGVLIYELVCLAMIVSASYLVPHSIGSQRLHPVLGGLLIGAAQGASLILTGGSIGVSTAYERVGQYICRFTGLGSRKSSSWPSLNPVIFVLGMLGGSWGLGQAMGVKVLEETVHISLTSAIIGGAALILGARTAGGCTSGHGISGMATLSKSSFVTVGAMFAGGLEHPCSFSTCYSAQ